MKVVTIQWNTILGQHFLCLFIFRILFNLFLIIICIIKLFFPFATISKDLSFFSIKFKFNVLQTPKQEEQLTNKEAHLTWSTFQIKSVPFVRGCSFC